MSQGKTIAIILGLVALGGVALLGLCAGGLFLGFQAANADASPQIEALFAAMNDGTFPETYDTITTAEFRSEMSQADYIALGESIAVRLGPLKEKTMTSFNMQTNSEGSFIDVDYDATFEKGNGTITAKLKKEGDVWKFFSFRVDSPVFEQDLARRLCPACGEPHAVGAMFCPSCGVPLANTEVEAGDGAPSEKSPDSASPLPNSATPEDSAEGTTADE